MTRPTELPTLATDSDYTNGPDAGSATRVKPSATELAEGFKNGKTYSPTAQAFNWLVGVVCDWIGYLDTPRDQTLYVASAYDIAVPTDATWFEAIIIPSGGGGAGGASGLGGGGGGGSGVPFVVSGPASLFGATFNVSVGAGGVAGAAGANGGDGASSSITGVSGCVALARSVGRGGEWSSNGGDGGDGYNGGGGAGDASEGGDGGSGGATGGMYSDGQDGEGGSPGTGGTSLNAGSVMSFGGGIGGKDGITKGSGGGGGGGFLVATKLSSDGTYSIGTVPGAGGKGYGAGGGGGEGANANSGGAGAQGAVLLTFLRR